jgi:twitching motility protein PilT
MCATAEGSALYLLSGSCPAVRVRGDMRVLTHERLVTPADIGQALIEFIPADALDSTDTTYAREVLDIGRVTCRALRDHRGAGVMFTMVPPAALLTTQLSLAPQALALCGESDGLIVVAGARASGKSTLVAALVDYVAQNRRDFVVTIEESIRSEYQSESSLVSQREADALQQPAAVRAAMRESADVIVVDELRTGESVRAVLAAAAHHLVVAAVGAADATAAIERLVDLLPADERAAGRQALSQVLRGVLAQRLARREQGRVAVRELLLNSPAVSATINAGRLADLASLCEV